MYLAHPNFRKQALQYHELLHGQMYAAQVPQQVQLPMSPMDYSYSQLMLPANLLATPSPYVSHSSFAQVFQPPALPFVASPGGFSAGPGAAARTYSQPSLLLHASLEHLSFSRTVLLTGLSAALSVREILDHIDHGPLEAVTLTPEDTRLREATGPWESTSSETAPSESTFSEIAPSESTFSEIAPSETTPSKTAPSETTGTAAHNAAPKDATQSCALSFVNTYISYNFHQKYAKSPGHLKTLRSALAGSARLQIAAPNPASLDVMRVKTLNYIMEFNATRALGAVFRILDPDLVPLMEKAFRVRAARFGSIEHIVVSEDGDVLELEFVVHFTCIDAAIGLYEHYSSRIASASPGVAPPDDDRDDLVQLACLAVTFQPDRCDRTPLFYTRQPRLATRLPLSDAGLLVLVLSEQKRPLALHGPRFPLHSMSQLSLVGRASPPGFKAMDEASHHSSEAVDPHAGGPSRSVGSAGSHFGSDDSCPPSLNMGPTEYFPDQSFDSVHSSFAPDSYLHGPPGPYLGGVNAPYVSRRLRNHRSDSLSSCNRTIYLGNLHPKTTVEEIANNVRAGGLVELIKHYQSRRVCFITFVDPAVALKFYLSYQVLHQLVIRDSEITVNWGQVHSGPLPRKIACAVSSGASRNVYIGFRMGRQGPPDLKIPDESTLRRDFSKFGPMEQINHLRKKDCGFMNFLDISDAIEVVECFDMRDATRISAIVGDEGQFYEKYRHFKISYGKDRCGNALKFSYVKRDKVPETSARPASGKGSSNNITSHKKVDSIDEEAAYVFGISTNAVHECKSSLSMNAFAESTMIQDDDSATSPEPDKAADEKPRLSPSRPENTGRQESQNGGSTAMLEAAPGFDGRDPDDHLYENDDEEEEDDDDISIIINPEVDDPSFLGRKKPSRKKPQKIYHNNFELSDLLNAAFSANAASVESFSPNNSFTQLPHGASVYGMPHRPPIAPMQHLRHHPGELSFAPSPPLQGGVYGHGAPYGSGSQVMAEYLARSLHENYLYAASVLDENSVDNIRDLRKPTGGYVKK
ncbi:hypothetical protein METBIDRAFT_114381 [Metschnikowia bicuspidata var. bicuspidata NRRL YB-4993]|uniref:RRM domain-containing protein n=1 Tax=Metschnikowia bicuspidata var. bicuspidata NRRL YB-4993 TaxID=869754 RepID=A0A1A0HJ37_9ASCO|nr:hypothetical protein METBIDRAFT_114381 [Metschnikowia bicuspidata var. bicuspidata NRRL YB-4993]OBA23853.1 hypothetical protein METBIDRAFT_114381 [Metschnikowia bicuspidata var. bicuspidata NRRL YB-4993]